MSEHYCTLFDSSYLPRALVMYRTLARADPGCTVHALCMDEGSWEIVHALALPGLIPIRRIDFETPELLRVRPGRTVGEYCWTCTAHLVSYALRHFDLARVTYVDADLCFYASPARLLDEMARANASALITPHRYTPKYDQTATAGRYCVQFMPFVNDLRGREIAAWWGERCLEWCFNRCEDGKFGDQKYLDDWPERFNGVHVLGDKGGGVGPWNVQQYALAKTGDQVHVDGIPLVFYHFHAYTYEEGGVHDFGSYELPLEAIELLYKPYAHDLLRAHSLIRTVRPRFRIAPAPRGDGFKRAAGWIRRAFRGARNRYRIV